MRDRGTGVEQPDVVEPHGSNATGSGAPIAPPYAEGDPEELISLEVRTGDADTAVVAVSGEVDMYTAPLLEDCLRTESVAASRRLVVDLSQVDFLDSSGLALLVQVHQQAKEQERELRVVCVEGIVKRAITSTGLDSTLALYADVTSASD
ncbi:MULTISPECIES: STAS domain-containing protein [unclassified Crossiella]|uniref:STAS domain-containing protein n=1 Tax=unclassified Crossiella TaxID=2620835 RepID=UPI001FFE3843|nr:MULTISPECIES: STAS domain-containing protein [unclassified Crossiella]MCK2245476.1 STAS domain-containing protein [Crossiella sp. S99.2]MCK2259112.1 STAS domain-containing protein [Crossiella sp. S99.1]